jgi:uncharacterized surface protein with fasciclin (FAS1) repeats
MKEFMKRLTSIKNISVLCLLAIFTLVVSCAEEFVSPKPITGTTLVDVAATDTTLQIFTAALVKTGIGISLDNISSGQHTVFAPTDSAFRAYFKASGPAPASAFNTDQGVIDYINTMSGSSLIRLADFTTRLQYHVVSSEAKFADIHNSQVFTTINAARLSLSKNTNTLFINGNTGGTGAKSKVVDIDGANGVIHTINKFLTAISTSTTAGAASVITSTGFGLGLTVSYTTSPATVTNGATGGGNYDLLALSIKKTGLATVLRPNVPAATLPDYTIFAPDDAAMVTYLASADMSNGTVTDEASAVTYINGLAAGNAKLTALTDVLKYHVTPGRVLSTDLTVNQEVTTLLTGKTISVVAITPSVILDGDVAGQATVTGSNILSNAGVLHRLNAVLKP